MRSLAFSQIQAFLHRSGALTPSRGYGASLSGENPNTHIHRQTHTHTSVQHLSKHPVVTCLLLNIICANSAESGRRTRADTLPKEQLIIENINQ